ncbi:MAG: ABC transporter ATP-binding protein [Thermoproteales archaeon]|nr:ABC transporter ATP-binding protein [Thermoproteales archaeon]
MGKGVVVFDSVTKRFGEVTALDKISFTLRRGLNFLVGPNGSGKSTAINIMLGLMKQDAGFVEVMGEEPRKVVEKGLVGALPEKYHFYDFMTGVEYLSLVAEIKGASRDDVKELIDALSLGDYVNKVIRGYSKGTLQKVAIVQALLGDPPLLILDEPFANLDFWTSRKLIDILRDKAKKNVSVVLSTHALSHIKGLNGYAVVVRKGRIVKVGYADEVLGKLWRTAVVKTSEPEKIVNRLVKLGLKARLSKRGLVVVVLEDEEERTKLWETVKDLGLLESVEISYGVLDEDEAFDMVMQVD